VSGVCYMNVFYICMIVCVSQKPDLRGAGRGPHFYNALCLWSGRARRKSKSFVYSKLIKLVCLESRRFPGEQSTLWSAEARKAAVCPASLDAKHSQFNESNRTLLARPRFLWLFSHCSVPAINEWTNLTPFKLRVRFALVPRKNANVLTMSMAHDTRFGFWCIAKCLTIRDEINNKLEEPQDLVFYSP
jgi:hypothetical protein